MGFLELSHVQKRFGGFSAVEDFELSAQRGEFVSFLRDYVAARRIEPRDDLISHLIAAESAGQKLSEHELIAGTIQLLNAGHEATVHSIGNAVNPLRIQVAPTGKLSVNAVGQLFIHQIADTILNIDYTDTTPDTTPFGAGDRWWRGSPGWSPSAR